MKTEKGKEKENAFEQFKDLSLEAGAFYLRRQMRAEQLLLALQKALYGLMGVLVGFVLTYVILFRHLG